ncbi:DUF488 family protein, N3 subclade [Lachnospira multipara]|nr:DUF488 family protein [Lachnospira multipara]
MNNKILIKRAYENVSETDGTRILVDRLWPRGKSKDIIKQRVRALALTLI